MSRLPALTARKLLAALQRSGFVIERQRGSHAVLMHPDGREVVVPVHGRDLKRPTMLAIIKQAGLTHEEFLTFL